MFEYVILRNKVCLCVENLTEHGSFEVPYNLIRAYELDPLSQMVYSNFVAKETRKLIQTSAENRRKNLQILCMQKITVFG